MSSINEKLLWTHILLPSQFGWRVFLVFFFFVCLFIFSPLDTDYLKEMRNSWVGLLQDKGQSYGLTSPSLSTVLSLKMSNTRAFRKRYLKRCNKPKRVSLPIWNLTSHSHYSSMPASCCINFLIFSLPVCPHIYKNNKILFYHVFLILCYVIYNIPRYISNIIY